MKEYFIQETRKRILLENETEKIMGRNFFFLQTLQYLAVLDGTDNKVLNNLFSRCEYSFNVTS